MIEMKKQITPGETPEKITVSMIDQDLKDGISKSEMAIKYGIKPCEVDEMFKHPFLKGRRPSRKKALSFIFEDDTLPLNSGDGEVETHAREDAGMDEIDPNQVTLEDAIDDAIESATQAQESLAEAAETIEEIFPTEIEDEKPMQADGLDSDLLDEEHTIQGGDEEEELEVDDDTFEL